MLSPGQDPLERAGWIARCPGRTGRRPVRTVRTARSVPADQGGDQKVAPVVDQAGHPAGKAMSTMSTPTAEGKSCQLGGRKMVLPSTSAAPSTAPRAEPSPPTAVEVNTTRLTGTRKGVSTYCWFTTRRRQPASPAMNPESANAVSLARTTRTPYPEAARSLAGRARRTRPVRLCRRPCSARSTTTRVPRHSSKTEVCDVMDSPKK